MNVKNQTALITGASSGIGAACTLNFAKHGYDLMLFGRNEDRLKKIAQEAQTINSKIKVKFLAFDLSDLNQKSNEILSELSNLAPLSVLINNAGLFNQGSLLDTSSETWEQQFNINLLAPVQLAKLLWSIFIKNSGGSIVNISSTLGLKPTPHTQAYSAIKAALINWTLSLAQEGGVQNIRVNCICPGIVDTPIHSFHNLDKSEKQNALKSLNKLQLLQSTGQPAHVADAVYFLASDSSSWTTGSILNIDGGINIK